MDKMLMFYLIEVWLVVGYLIIWGLNIYITCILVRKEKFSILKSKKRIVKDKKQNKKLLYLLLYLVPYVGCILVVIDFLISLILFLKRIISKNGFFEYIYERSKTKEDLSLIKVTYDNVENIFQNKDEYKERYVRTLLSLDKSKNNKKLNLYTGLTNLNLIEKDIYSTTYEINSNEIFKINYYGKDTRYTVNYDRLDKNIHICFSVRDAVLDRAVLILNDSEDNDKLRYEIDLQDNKVVDITRIFSLTKANIPFESINKNMKNLGYSLDYYYKSYYSADCDIIKRKPNEDTIEYLNKIMLFAIDDKNEKHYFKDLEETKLDYVEDNNRDEYLKLLLDYIYMIESIIIYNPKFANLKLKYNNQIIDYLESNK